MSKEKQPFLKTSYDLREQADTDAFYDKWADSYDKELTENEYAQPERCSEALSAVETNTEAKILDVGCGTGLSGRALSHAGFKNIDGCDIAVAMLEKAKLSGVYGNLFVADLNAPPINVENDSYDAATVVGVFSFGHVMPDALDEFCRTVRIGGHLIIGLNQYFYDDSGLQDKIDSLVAQHKIEVLGKDLGTHIAGTDTKGWVITLKKLK